MISERGLEYGLECGQLVPLVVDEEEFKLAPNTKDSLFQFWSVHPWKNPGYPVSLRNLKQLINKL